MVTTLNENADGELDGSVTVIAGDPRPTTIPPASVLEDGAPRCSILSDQYLRANYWYYLNKAQLLSAEVVATNIRNYSLLVYSNIVGTFLVITSCE